VRNQLDNESIEKEKRNTTRGLIASPLSPKLPSTIDLKNAPGNPSLSWEAISYLLKREQGATSRNREQLRSPGSQKGVLGFR